MRVHKAKIARHRLDFTRDEISDDSFERYENGIKKITRRRNNRTPDQSAVSRGERCRNG